MHSGFLEATDLCLKTGQLRLKVLYLPLQGNNLSTDSLRLHLWCGCCLGEYVLPRRVLVEVVYLFFFNWKKWWALFEERIPEYLCVHMHASYCKCIAYYIIFIRLQIYNAKMTQCCDLIHDWILGGHSSASNVHACYLMFQLGRWINFKTGMTTSMILFQLASSYYHHQWAIN